MKKLNFFVIALPLFVAATLFTIASCTKEGPQGPPGESSVETCAQCHNFSEDVLAKQIQYAASGHLNGGTYERNGSSCAPCHTSMGFREVIQTGEMETAAAISDPTPVNCYTCHNIHDSYTSNDWELRLTSPVTFWIDGETSDQGTANVCLNCHQSRTVNPALDPSTPNAMVEITSYRFGPHHGPQGNMVNGTGGYEIGSGYGNSAHANIENTCVTCHMAEAYGNQSGGHTWKMGYVYHGHTELNTAGCVDCHENTDDLPDAVEEVAEELETLMAQLASILISQGVMDSTYYAIETTMTMNQAGGIFNYKFVEEDLSGGMHNFSYAKKLLENSIESLQ